MYFNNMLHDASTVESSFWESYPNLKLQSHQILDFILRFSHFLFRSSWNFKNLFYKCMKCLLILPIKLKAAGIPKLFFFYWF